MWHYKVKDKFPNWTRKSEAKKSFRLPKETNKKHSTKKKRYGKKVKKSNVTKCDNTGGRNQELHGFWGLSTPVLNKSLVLTLEESRSQKSHWKFWTYWKMVTLSLNLLSGRAAENYQSHKQIKAIYFPLGLFLKLKCELKARKFQKDSQNKKV